MHKSLLLSALTLKMDKSLAGTDTTFGHWSATDNSVQTTTGLDAGGNAINQFLTFASADLSGTENWTKCPWGSSRKR